MVPTSRHQYCPPALGLFSRRLRIDVRKARCSNQVAIRQRGTAGGKGSSESEAI